MGAFPISVKDGAKITGGIDQSPDLSHSKSKTSFCRNPSHQNHRDGKIIVGPNAVLGLAREGYEKFSFKPQDVFEYMAFPGFWRVIGAHFSAGVEEMRNSLWKQGYLAQCRKYCPDLSLADLEPGVAGIRAQAVLRDGTLVHDFLFAETARMLHVCNAPSPAATSAIPIARMIAEKVLVRFEHCNVKQS